MRAVIPAMIDHGGGRIVNIASSAGMRGIANMAAYSAAKGGVIALTRQAAVDYGAHNVLINCICPGPMDTPALHLMPDELRARYLSYQILPRLGDVANVTSLIVHCFSADGDFLTGAVIPVDGGLAAKA
jgi:NAD(P)-dependent dehydrogenase (short-subunit alcohol dehydrogenase family)